MKKLFLTTAMVLGTFGMAFAQTNATQDVTINGVVLQAIQLSVNTATLSLGTMVAGTTPAPISATTSPIEFTLTGNASSAITVTYSSVTMTGSNGGSLTFTPTIVGDPSSSNQSGASNVNSGSTVNLAGTNYTSANYYFWLGGSVGPVSVGQTPGSYSGTFTLQVAY